MGAPEKVKNALFALSGNRCAFPTCKQKLVIPSYDLDNGSPHIAEAAHIIGEKPGSARHDPDYPKNKLNSLENLITLCPTCHKKIDKNPDKYSVDMLIETKMKNEYMALSDNVTKISFSELDVATKALAIEVNNVECQEDYEITPIEEKLKKNYLSDDVKQIFEDMLYKTKIVEEYLSYQAKFDSEFPNRLKIRFKEQYDIFSKEFSGDILFFKMKSWVELDIDYGKTKNIIKIQAAAFVILCHLFEICEVFER